MKYYYNVYTQVSTYECPPELAVSVEPPKEVYALTGSIVLPTKYHNRRSPWTEHKTEAGRAYWHNSVTGVSTWKKPEELGGPPAVVLGKEKEAKDKPSAGGGDMKKPATPQPGPMLNKSKVDGTLQNRASLLTALFAVQIHMPKILTVPKPETASTVEYKINGEVFQWKFDEKVTSDQPIQGHFNFRFNRAVQSLRKRPRAFIILTLQTIRLMTRTLQAPARREKNERENKTTRISRRLILLLRLLLPWCSRKKRQLQSLKRCWT